MSGGGNRLSSCNLDCFGLRPRNDRKAAFTLAEGTTCVAMSNGYRKAAFTLAEVLITLGIIGVVAALTMPALISNHRKSVVENKLKKFYSSMSQAVIMSEAAIGASPNEWDTFSSAYNGAEMEAWFNKYLKNYLQVLEATRKGSYVYVALSDGTGFVIFNHFKTVNGIHVYFCTDYKKCSDKPDGKNVFTFMFYKNGFSTYGQGSSLTREQLLSPSLDCACATNQSYPHYCSNLIQREGWKIPDDYPFRI